MLPDVGKLAKKTKSISGSAICRVRQSSLTLAQNVTLAFELAGIILQRGNVKPSVSLPDQKPK